jgi:pSer/pThr/pTyr-binding forkhead associated (FHA) protein
MGTWTDHEGDVEHDATAPPARGPAAAALQSSKMWVLRTISPGEEGERTFRILPGGVRTIGRTTAADFIIDEALVSRVHCRLTATRAGELEIRDLDSTNGTFVNGRRVDVALISSGDTLQVGRVELVATRDDTP